jgi:hypothetical protein
MAWIKVDDQMVDHPKIESLSDAAFRWTHRGLSYANRFLTNGRLPVAFTSKVPAAVVDELTTIRPGHQSPVWHRDADGTMKIHDFKKYQPSKAEVERERRLARARQAKWRHARSNAVTNGGGHGAPARPSGPSASPSPLKPPRTRAPRLSQAMLDQLDRNDAAVEAQKAAAKMRETS